MRHSGFLALFFVLACYHAPVEGGTGGGGGSLGSAGGTGGMGGSGGSGGNAGGTAGGSPLQDAGTTCQELMSSYGAAVPKAEACEANEPVVHCTKKRERILGCGCYQYMENTTTLDAISAQWMARNCLPPACPAVFCPDPDGGVCSNGTCVNTF